MELADEARAALSKVEATEAGFRARLCVPPSASVLAGHFPGHPVVPAVYLIEACQAAAAQARQTGPLRTIRSAKFLLQVTPGAEVCLEGELEALACGAWILDVEISLAGEKAAILSLELEV